MLDAILVNLIPATWIIRIAIPVSNSLVVVLIRTTDNMQMCHLLRRLRYLGYFRRRLFQAAETRGDDCNKEYCQHTSNHCYYSRKRMSYF